MRLGLSKVMAGLGYQKSGTPTDTDTPIYVAPEDTLLQAPEPIPVPEISLKWQSSNFEASAKKSPIWHLNLIIVSIALAVAFYFIGGKDDYLTPAATIIGSIALSAFTFIQPKPKDIILVSDPAPTLSINGVEYPISNFKSFSIDYDTTSQSYLPISFLKKDRFTFYITVLVPTEIAEEVIAFLDATLPEDVIHSHAGDKLAKLIGL